MTSHTDRQTLPLPGQTREFAASLAELVEQELDRRVHNLQELVDGLRAENADLKQKLADAHTLGPRAEEVARRAVEEFLSGRRAAG